VKDVTERPTNVIEIAHFGWRNVFDDVESTTDNFGFGLT